MKMSAAEYAFARDESVSRGVRRIAVKQLEYAHSELDGSLRGEAGDERVHEARKTIKRLRGLIRLVRDGLGDPIYREENECLRCAALHLAAAREAAAVNEAWDKVVLRFRSEVVAREVDGLRGRLRAHGDRAVAEGLDPSTIAEVRRRLGQVRARMEDWPLRGDGWSALESGMRRVYARGRKDLRRALHVPTAMKLHEWRKSVKYHWFHVRLLHSSWPGPMGARRDALKMLSDLLGDDHDLSELTIVLLQLAGDPPVVDSSLARLLELIERRRQELISDAFGLGMRIYAERPRRLTERLGVYYETWQSRPATGALVTQVGQERGNLGER